MSGVGFFWEDESQDCPDLQIENGQLKFDEGLETAIFISAFSDRFVSLDQLPVGTTDQKGWRADLIAEVSNDLIGSEFWRLAKAKTSPQLAAFFEDAARDMLQWMIDDGVAQSVTAVATVIDNQQIDVAIEILRPDGDDIPFKFVWDGQSEKISVGDS